MLRAQSTLSLKDGHYGFPRRPCTQPLASTGPSTGGSQSFLQLCVNELTYMSLQGMCAFTSQAVTQPWEGRPEPGQGVADE